LDSGSPLPLSVTGDIQSGRGLPQSKTLPRVNETLVRKKLAAQQRDALYFYSVRISGLTSAATDVINNTAAHR
jgi:hypothetical protein